MDKRVKEKWIKALRSGEYEQGMGALRSTDDKFCCLGVLCDLYSREFGVKWSPVDGADDRHFLFRHESDDRRFFLSNPELLPKEVSEWAGFGGESNPRIGDGVDAALSNMNDSGDYSFEEIADLIEEHL